MFALVRTATRFLPRFQQQVGCAVQQQGSVVGAGIGSIGAIKKQFLSTGFDSVEEEEMVRDSVRALCSEYKGRCCAADPSNLRAALEQMQQCASLSSAQLRRVYKRDRIG